MNELILMPIGTSGPWGKTRENEICCQEVKRQGHVRLEIDWRSGGSIILDAVSSGQLGFLALTKNVDNV